MYNAGVTSLSINTIIGKLPSCLKFTFDFPVLYDRTRHIRLLNTGVTSCMNLLTKSRQTSRLIMNLMLLLKYLDLHSFLYIYIS